MLAVHAWRTHERRRIRHAGVRLPGESSSDRNGIGRAIAWPLSHEGEYHGTWQKLFTCAFAWAFVIRWAYALVLVLLGPMIMLGIA